PHGRSTGRTEIMDAVTLLTVVVLSVFVGFEVVSKVTSKLHTPLMSGANAIHGIILIGAIIVAGQTSDPLLLTVALSAVVLAPANLVGGFVVTGRRIGLFRGRNKPPTTTPQGDVQCTSAPPRSPPSPTWWRPSASSSP